MAEIVIFRESASCQSVVAFDDAISANDCGHPEWYDDVGQTLSEGCWRCCITRSCNSDKAVWWRCWLDEKWPQVVSSHTVQYRKWTAPPYHSKEMQTRAHNGTSSDPVMWLL